MGITTRLLSVDHDALIKTYHHYDEDTGLSRIETVQDVTPHLETAQAMRNDDSYSKDGVKNEMLHYARVPNVVAMIWKKKHGVDAYNQHHHKEVFKLLNSPEYSYLKTTKMKHK